MPQSLVVKYATKKVRVSKFVIPGNFSATLQAVDETGLSVGSPVVVTSATPEIKFDDVIDGLYVIFNARVDASGLVIGQTIADAITIAGGVVTVDQLVDSVASVSYELNVTPSDTAAAQPTA